ncbi:acetyltransferase (GNAT) family protein [Roseimicrobium gellanilyticum]|uniref:Acetyltransferase (GNAT) family protein n=1 Tax=Roseimicrobium gellanilyticum TaxID=748857 RepID=A0A366HHY9_9BACT|nr:GNAT family N-acetyltransferase [Roseimicrobium gellanilyticum]RBP42388.1 acetyltransferase (GNAT) family protein [Roseimicrobium gellanilyticum]
MISFLKNLCWRAVYPWPRSIVEGIRPLRISVCPESRFAECERLFDENTAHGIPANHRDEYQSSLRSGRLLTLIAEDANEVVGTFGVQYLEQKKSYWLCYLFISPKHHRKCIGTTLFFASIALLPQNHPDVSVCICNLHGTAGFYKRLGFLQVGEVDLPEGERSQVATLYLWPRAAKKIRAWLFAAGTRLPEPGYGIPIISLAPPPAPSPETPIHPPSPQ